MKNKIFKTLLALLLVLSIVGSVCACDGGDEYTGEYYNYGLHYTLPETYRQLTVPYSEFCYTDGNAYFYFRAYSGEQLEEDFEIDGNISVRSYTTKFMVWNDINLSKDTYYEDLDRSVIIYDFEGTDDEGNELEPECFYHVIFRGSQLLYIVTMTCPIDMKDTYTPVFDEWSLSLHAD